MLEGVSRQIHSTLPFPIQCIVYSRWKVSELNLKIVLALKWHTSRPNTQKIGMFLLDFTVTGYFKMIIHLIE